MANIVELIPGLTAIRKEMASLRELQARLSGDEATRLQAIILALDAALGQLLKVRR